MFEKVCRRVIKQKIFYYKRLLNATSIRGLATIAFKKRPLEFKCGASFDTQIEFESNIKIMILVY